MRNGKKNAISMEIMCLRWKKIKLVEVNVCQGNGYFVFAFNSWSHCLPSRHFYNVRIIKVFKDLLWNTILQTDFLSNFPQYFSDLIAIHQRTNYRFTNTASTVSTICSLQFHLLPSLLSWEDSVCTISVSTIAVIQAVYFCSPLPSPPPPTGWTNDQD